ncbi:hypothetical protein IZ6_22350 [Terrihabitans soli]|uniref:Uncharacterized protein n=1 Tax=Terrihabitans soli TaxID=708113 RepID=A0A6S6QWU0_9HYPH|nr:hypothetical protein [Terrihabitans soli]BCJ91500.1 hypothetical protein IZ6_22350 [Terrihabitans soli]
MSNEALVIQFLQWIGDEPRSYRETQDAWRTSCPRLDIWEEALRRGLIERLPAKSLSEAAIAVTPQGRALLNGGAT